MLRLKARTFKGEGPVAGFVLDLSPVWEDPSVKDSYRACLNDLIPLSSKSSGIA